MEETKLLNAEVISVFPNKIKIAVRDLPSFKVAEERLSVGSYLKISDNEDCALLAIIENYSIEIKTDKDGEQAREYILEAAPLGTIDAEGVFVRGGNNIAIPPTAAMPATKREIQFIYDNLEPIKKFCFSKLVQDANIAVPVDGDRFFNKHIAIVGSTGSGKSHTVATIFQEVIKLKEGSYKGLNNSHITIFDIHSEYKQAFPEANYINVDSLILPYWLMNSEELQDLFIESSEEQSHNQVSVLKKMIIDNKIKHFKGDDTLKSKIKYDSPLYFDINEVLLGVKAKNDEMVPGKSGEKQGPLYGKLSNFVDRLENKISDKRLEFLFGQTAKNSSSNFVLRQFLSYEKGKESNITIIDVSGVPFEVLSITVSLISRILFEYGYFYKKIKPDSKTETPVVIVYEEAHKYVPKVSVAKYNASRASIERIAKEGRKYGVTAVIVSQRPSEISETIFSQCSNFIAMRLTNPEDQNFVKKLLPDTLGPLTESLPILKAGEALVIGDSVIIPSLVKINQANPEPASSDIAYLQEWKKPWFEVVFEEIIKRWEQ
jgi:DNA helicase HerA-like ATPase